MSPKRSDLEAILDAVWREVEIRPDKVTGTRIVVPPAVPADNAPSESRFAADFPVLRHLNEAIAIAQHYEMAQLARSFGAVAKALAWSQNPSYTEENCDLSFLAGYAYAALSGPEGPVRCAAPRGGFMLMGPDVIYPAHQHAPREVYLILTPGAQWQLEQGDWFDVAPGDLIFHEAWQKHAMRTTAQPLLAFAGWVEPGDRLAIGWSAGAA